jgi:hypothetical protein
MIDLSQRLEAAEDEEDPEDADEAEEVEAGQVLQAYGREGEGDDDHVEEVPSAAARRGNGAYCEENA